MLETRWLQWFGSRSYGLYLWHGPLLAALRDQYRLPLPLLMGVGLPLSMLLAELSFRFVEAPFRATRQPVRRADAELPVAETTAQLTRDGGVPATTAARGTAAR